MGFVKRIFASDGVIRRFDDGFVYVDVFPIAVMNWKGFGMGYRGLLFGEVVFYFFECFG